MRGRASTLTAAARATSARRVSFMLLYLRVIVIRCMHVVEMV